MSATMLEPGRYICAKTSGFVPWVIRQATDSPVDHAAVVVGGNQVVEAEPQDVIVSPLSKYAGSYVVGNVAEQMTPRQLAAVEAKALSLVGVGYNFAAVGDDLFQDALGWHWRWALYLAGADHRLDCSQLAAVCGLAAGKKNWLCGRPSPCAVTPGDLARRPGVRRVAIT